MVDVAPLMVDPHGGRSPVSVALIRQRYTAFGGAERFAQEALTSLARGGGVRLTLLTRRWDQPLPGIEVVTRSPFHVGRLWRDWGFARSACRWLDAHPHDLVQSHERLACCHLYRAGDGVHREWLRQRTRVMGRWGALGEYAPYHRYLLAAEGRLFRSSRLRAVICNSRMVRGEIQEYFGLDRGKLPVIYNGVDQVRFHPGLVGEFRRSLRQNLAISEGSLLLLLVGSGYQRKGVPQVLQALVRLPREVILVVVGRERRLGVFQSLARRLGLADRVRFVGPQQDVVPYYGAADALVLPTLYDPFPNVVLEAMACGLPVVTSFKCGAVDFIRHGENGLLSDALDIGQITRNLEVLLDLGRCREIGEAGRESVLPLTPEVTAEKLLALYRRLLDQARE